MVYILQSAEDFPQDCIAEYDKGKSPDRFIFTNGEILDTLELPIVFNVFKPIDIILKIDYICNQTSVPLVSPQMASLLEANFKYDIQFFDTIINVQDDIIDTYKLVNIIHSVKAINHKLSDYELVPGTKEILYFNSLTYNNDCLNGFDMARDEEYDVNLIVSQKVKDVFEQSKLVGYGIFSPEETI